MVQAGMKDETIIVPPIQPDRTQFKKVTTGNGYDRDLAATTNDRLELTVIELQKLQINNTEQTKKLGTLLGTLDDSISYLQGDIKVLISTIKDANDKNDRLQRWFLVLSLISAIFAGSGIIQAWDILTRGIGK
ncbi:MAG: hypothetical protein COU25_00355 [Candidatus Levybacteria bacterium CG10_big_fil_rev_8_21_14_0_10_35_13]|nr:MAG: hypothetical protein COU25_00355 [Candidatus Levybacteria bacterium CG10_big_fil_rev_8_21_14_0_10_35_13]